MPVNERADFRIGPYDDEGTALDQYAFVEVTLLDFDLVQLHHVPNLCRDLVTVTVFIEVEVHELHAVVDSVDDDFHPVVFEPFECVTECVDEELG